MHNDADTDIPLLEVRSFSLRYGEKTILDEVNFSIRRGERAAVIGPNGAGKSSLLRSIAFLEDRWQGEILLDGRSVRQWGRRNLARRMAAVAQIPEDFFALSVRRLVELGRYPYLDRFSPPAEEDRLAVDAVLARCRIAEFADRSLSTLSGGERQRVMIAAALAQEPELLLLDEPSVFLDLCRQNETARLLNEVHASGTTLLEVTHDLNRSVLDQVRTIAAAKGKIRYDGPAEGMMNTDLLREIFGLDFPIVPHPENGLPMVLPR